jgi:hypothetical protein
MKSTIELFIPKKVLKADIFNVFVRIIFIHLLNNELGDLISVNKKINWIDQLSFSHQLFIFSDFDIVTIAVVI